jgi:hypothetical protein
MKDEIPEARVNWRLVYGAVIGWLILMIVLMRLFTTTFA